METLTVTSSLLAPTTDKPLTPAMLTVLWVIASELDHARIPAKVEDSVWLDIPTRALRPETRTDNAWLRECLERLTGVKIGGEYRNNPWGAVLISEWHIVQGGALCRVHIPPAGVQALRLPETFAKIEIEAAYRLEGPARRLYAALADKKRLGQPHWTYSLEELRRLFDVEGKKSYERWQALKQWVITPALEQINDYGTVTVKMTPQKRGRSVVKVRFDWRWKTIDEARSTEEENERPAIAHHQDKAKQDAPPLIPDQTQETKRKLTEEERQKGRSRLAEMKALLR